MWPRAISLLVLAGVAAGCGSGGGGDGESELACPHGLTRPFSVETLIRVAQENGVSLKQDRICSGSPASVEAASNIVIGDDVQDDDEVRDREGHVICDLEDLPFAEPPFRVTRTKYATDQETYFDVANVNCAIYPSGEGQIDRLEAAFEALGEAPVEQRSCPTMRPRPVTVERLIDAAKANGLRLLPDARCMEPGVVAQASTVIPYIQSEKADAVFEDQGDVTCLLRASAVPGANEIRTTEISAATRFELRNVSCTIFPNYEREAAQVERVRATLEDLG